MTAGRAGGPPAAEDGAAATSEARAPGGFAGGQRPDFSSMTPEQLEGIKDRMRERGMTDEQIEARIKMMRERAQQGDSGEGSSDN